MGLTLPGQIKPFLTRSDRAFVNAYWFNPFGYCQINYMFQGCPKPKSTFLFCDMRIRDPSFIPLVESNVLKFSHNDPNTRMRDFLSKFADLRAQLCIARAVLETIQDKFLHDPGNTEWKQKEDLARAHYIHILSSVIDIIKQQSKDESISYGDNCTNYFFAKIKRSHLYFHNSR
ncbi:hypothetical protein Cgig2_020479 [Carnegiea gigantea]|uniref:Uncharacterized protein n=1 Tax=Carnegiea gigantea TaxID=171969 RepID=A0A9Q1GFQ8_9CARY|nr:hypothetical protein Cgig2_020479 [Carnegiea gigantea]